MAAVQSFHQLSHPQLQHDLSTNTLLRSASQKPRDANFNLPVQVGEIQTSLNSKWIPMCHPRALEVATEVDAYFLQHWKFPNTKSKKKFLQAGFSRVTCLYFPLAKDERIHLACRLLTILFLIDDVLEEMSFADGEAYNASLMNIMRGEVHPNRSVPVEYIMYDLWEDMRAHDKELADAVLEPTFTFMRAQTDRARLSIDELGRYLEYRERDVGKALLSFLMRFSMDLHLTPEELADMTLLERNCSKHISVVNDIFSWEKELQASENSQEEGSVLCTSVKILADETNLSVVAAKRVLWSMIREWEVVHDELVSEKFSQNCTQAERDNMKGLEYQMSGNELWSRTTLRYSGSE